MRPPDDPGGLPLAVGSLALAGYVDAVGYLRVHGLFVSFMSGNTTTLAVIAVGPERNEFMAYSSVLLAFVLGVMIGELICGSGRRFAQPSAMALTAILLLCSAHIRYLGAFGASCLLAAAMGCQNAGRHHAEGEPVSVTYVTGTLVHVGRSLAGAIAGRSSPRSAGLHAMLWCGLLFGATLGAIASGWRTDGAIDAAAGAALSLSSLTLVQQRPRSSWLSTE